MMKESPASRVDHSRCLDCGEERAAHHEDASCCPGVSALRKRVEELEIGILSDQKMQLQADLDAIKGVLRATRDGKMCRVHGELHVDCYDEQLKADLDAALDLMDCAEIVHPYGPGSIEIRPVAEGSGEAWRRVAPLLEKRRGERG